MKIYTVDFEPMWPVGCCLVIQARSVEEATEIAKETITHTDVFTVTQHVDKKPGVVVYISGDY